MVIQPARQHERGQALPLLVLALIALAGFAALALDGGNLWTEQRRAQAAADNAVMAAAYQEMQGFSGANLSNAAFANAAQNGYVQGPATSVAFHLPPIHGAYAGNSQYMEVVITQTVPTALAHLVYGQDPIPLTVIAVAHGFPTGPLMPGYAIAAMKPNCTENSSTIYLNADGGGSSGGTVLTDGGAFVNSNCAQALTTNGDHDGIRTNGPPIAVVGGTTGGSVCSSQTDPTNCSWYPAPTTGVPAVPQNPLQGTPAGTPPPCNGPNQPPPTSGGTIQPGSYMSLDSKGHDLTLRPGIYCLTGGALTSGNGNLTGIGVLIYLVDTPANISFAGSGTLNLQAPTTATTVCTGTADPPELDHSEDICPYLGIVVYKVTGSNTCLDAAADIVFTGSSSMNVTGLVYAPYSLVKYGGLGNLTMTGQTIAGCVKFNGNGNINIIYNPNATYSPPPSVRLDE